MKSDRGQASVEWVGIVALLSMAVGVAFGLAPRLDGRSLGGLIAHRIACSAKIRCGDADRELRRAYGDADAALVRRHLPGLVYESGERQIPVDWRRCRAVACAAAPDDRGLDVHRTDAGRRATVFTRVLRRGGERHIQYWMYYPDSNTTWAGSDRIWRASPVLQAAGLAINGSTKYPGFHRDDWEAASVAVGRDGRALIRVSSHGHWQWCKWSHCQGRWGPSAGWARVSRGSHAGHVPIARGRPAVPGRDVHERTTTPDAVRLVPLEGLDRRAYRRLDPDIAPPWEKDSYSDPLSPRS